MICQTCKQTITYPSIQWTGKNLKEVLGFIAPATLEPVVGRGRLEYNGLISIKVGEVRRSVFTGDHILKTPEGLQVMGKGTV